jgi:hypothetical protein
MVGTGVESCIFVLVACREPPFWDSWFYDMLVHNDKVASETYIWRGSIARCR